MNRVKQQITRLPILILIINVFFISFLLSELIDATPPNYGGFGLIAPILSMIALYSLREWKTKSYSKLVLQVVHWLFIIFPICVFVVIAIAFIPF
ncbi:hypothetical protein [Salsuginibacillus kocurii]|uniref:hypothetical protein n=1 Tax=Salsuginibacillus kocurii TaxID=427078 RepID=UPI00037427C1|nr:hypothetical protein [Salsuginibacillus kocurii]